MKKDFFKKLIFFIVSSCIFVSGCSFSGDDDNKALKAAIVMAANNSSSSEKVLVNLNFDTPRGGTMLPDQELTNLEFKGTRLEGGSFSTTADSKDDLCSKKIWLQTGKWNFTLSGVIDGVPFYDTLEEFELTKEHASLSFKLKPGNGISNGGLYLILNFTGAADSAELKVTDTETNVTVESQTYSSFESVPGNSEKKKIEYSKTFKTQDSDGLAPGTYLITVDFYRAGMKTGDLPLNTWKAYARIKAGLTAATEVDDYDLTDSYTITYHNVDTATLDSSGVAVACFSRKSGTITLPAYINAEGFNVLCWYETENFNISTPGITEFAAKNNLRNLDFYPLWDTDTAYAAAGGSGNGLTEANPASSVEAALSSLKTIHGTAYGSTQNALTVQIDGVVEGNTVIGTDYDYAESLTLTGKTGNENDSLKGSGSGCVLEVRTSKPVTLTKLKITGGRGVNYGGGIYICGNSSVILEDGALIEGNEANKQGGGIYVSRNTGAPGRTSLTINAGAKISGNKIKEDETYGNNGGMAIYVYGAKVEMNGGEISQNNGQTINQRGAVRLNEDAVLDLNDGKITDNTVMHIGGNIFCSKSTINMKGGEISEGKASTKNSGGGGGGLWIEGASSFNMTGGIFLNNTAENGSGGAVYICGKNLGSTPVDGPVFSISGTAYIPSATKQSKDNDIYYQKNSDGKTYPAIEITDELTPKTEDVQKGKIALSPKLWERKQIVLKKAATAPSELDISVFKPYFAFTDAGSTLSFAPDKATLTAPYYVASNGTDEDDTPGTETAPFQTLEYALGRLTDGADETIRVNGTLKGTQVIPDGFTTTNCKSLTIIGANGLDAQGNPKDVLTLADDAGSGSVLTINTQVPVTLKNIKITGGKGTPGLDNTDYTTGGGIYTGQNATLKLADGVLITGNTVTLSGGGIYLGNNSDLYMYGSSYVGDNQQRLAVHDSSTEDCANAAGYGGGIYNNGNVYLGYSGKDNSGNLIAEDWTGGICRNCAGNGGGIDSSTGSTVKMRTGKISYNSAKYSKTGYVPYEQFGGGIYSYDTGAVEIIAGEISHNAAKSGGGIYINDNGTVLKLKGGKMESNSADENGGAINYKDGKIEVSGNVYIPCTGEKQNDVYLAEGKFITIAGNLSLPTSAPTGAKNVTITPYEWKRGNQVLGASGTSAATLIQNNVGNFATIDEDFTVDQKSGETTKGVLSAPIYVASDGVYDDTRYGNKGSSSGARGTREKPYSSLSTALSEVDASSHIIYIDGTFKGKTEISSTTLPNTDMLTLRGYKPEGQTVAKATLNGEFSSFADKNTTLIINGAKKVDIYDLTIKGGNNKSDNYGTDATPGGGILITGSAEVTLGSGATITDNTACYGGGVSVFNGKLTVNDGAVISKNTAKKNNSSGGYGGGIYVGKNGSLSLAGGMIGDSTLTVNGNNAMRGGGIYADYNGEAPDVMRLEMTGGSVSHNLREVDGTYKEAGAGLYICGKARISGGVIDHNTTAGNSPKGGGIYLDSNSICTISGDVEISNNEAYYGAGIYSYTDKLTVEGGIFRNNNAEVAGGAILADKVLYLKGNPVFYKSGDVIEKHKNDINLYQYTASIRITGPVTTSYEYVAAVTPHDFKRGERLLSASGDEDISNMDEALLKFVLTEDNEGWNREKIEPSWDSSMRLYIINSPIYVVGTGHNSFFQDPPASGATGTKNMPYASIFAAEEAMDDNSMDYEVIVDGSITGPQKFSYSDYTSLRAKSVIIKGYKPTDTYSVTATLNGNSTGSALTIDAKTAEFPVTIQDLTITGGSATNGGGINITQGTVKLTDGAKITGNTATSNGGGVYVSSNGTLFMYGKALVGDVVTGSTATTSATTSSFANKAASGGGIYSEGSVYLGYSAWSGSSGTAEPLETGYGVRRNFATGDYAGIYGIDTGTVRIKTGYVSYNAASSNGGGLGGNFILEGGTVSGNKASNGAGVYIPNGVTTSSITSGTVSSNIASTNGGAAYIVNGGKLTLSDGTISANEAINGGGIFTYNYTSTSYGTFEMSGGTLSGNKATGASGKGGAIYNTGTVTMTGGAIGASGSLNTAAGTNGQGGAIYQNGTFNVSGSAYVYPGSEKSNDVYLTSGKSVAVNGSWSGSQASTSKMTLTPPTWTRGTTVVSKGSSLSGNITTDILNKFSVSDSEWSAVLYGSGASAVGKIDADIWVAGSGTLSSCSKAGNDSTGNGTKAKPYASITTAVGQCWGGPKDTATGGRIINVEGTVTAATNTEQTISSSITSAKATAIKLSGNGSDVKLQAASGKRVLSIYTAVPVTITNMTISGGSTTDNGAGIYVSAAKASLTLTTSAVVTGNSTTAASGKGGGIYIAGASGTGNAANLIMNGTAQISGNSASGTSGAGGGVYLYYANLCMSGNALIGETSGSAAATSSSTGHSNMAKNGGGVYCDTGSNVYLGFASASDSGTSLSKGIRRNYASSCGGGIYVNGGAVTLKTGYVSYNGTAATSGCDGGGIWQKSGTTVTISGGTIAKNKGYYGGGVYAGGTFTMSGGAIGDSSTSISTAATSASYSNYAAYGGGIYAPSGASVSLNSGYVSYNYASVHGGGIKAIASITFKSNANYNGTAGNGGGIYANTFILSSGTIKGNEAAGNGGGIACAVDTSYTLTISGGTVTENKALNGGGVYGGAIGMTGGTISSNTATNTAVTDEYCGGGGIFADTYYLILTGGSIQGNISKGNGGGVLMRDSYLYMSGSAVIGNSGASAPPDASGKTKSNNADYDGGGIYANCDGAVFIGYTNSTPTDKTKAVAVTSMAGGVYYNYSGRDGGGICNFASNGVKIAKGNIKYNASPSGNGGGVCFTNASNECFIYDGSVDGNKALNGGGVYLDGVSLTMSGGTVSANTATNNSTTNASKNGGGGVYLNDPTNGAKYFKMTAGTIAGNTSKKNGGGLLINGGKFFMSGTAVIGYADAGTSTDATTVTGSNKADDCGGGIYAGAKSEVYIGYSDSSTLAQMSTYENSCIRCNYAKNYGGGLYTLNFNTTFFKFASGWIAFNRVGSSGYGAGIYHSGKATSYIGFSSNSYGPDIVGNSSGNAYEYFYGSTNSLSSQRGGGIYNVGVITFSKGKIRSNYAKEGGGVYNASGATFTMNGDGAVIGSTATYWGDDNDAIDGGGVYNGGTFTISAGYINKNRSHKYGGGVYTFGGTFTISGGQIYDNAANKYQATYDCEGGGIYISGGTVNVSGGSVSSNACGTDATSTTNCGGNIAFSSGTFNFTGGEVNGGYSKGYGNSIFAAQDFTMKGNAHTASGSGGEIYLKSGACINIPANLTYKSSNTYSETTSIALITPASYANYQSVQVLKGSYVNTNNKKFNVSSNGGTEYVVSSTGYLRGSFDN